MKRYTFTACLLVLTLMTGCANTTRTEEPPRVVGTDAVTELPAASASVTETVYPAASTAAITETAAITTAEETAPAALAGIRIGLDPGHQAHGNSGQEAIAPDDPRTKDKVTGGAVGTATGIPEYVTVLEIADLLRRKLEAEGATVYMTRETHDVDISNQERTKMMNEYGVDLMLRIHCDASGNAETSGIGLFVSESNAIAAQSFEYAGIIQPIVCEAVGAQNRGITQNDNYTGQNWAEVPCIMIECGFLSNPEEDRQLNDPAYQEKLAAAICDGIKACFS